MKTTIGALDYYLGLALLCFALGADTCGCIAFGVLTLGMIAEYYEYKERKGR